jgi:cytochrome c-type biogenesis protein
VDAWLQHALSPEGLGLAALPAALLLGVLGALTSCCTLPVLGAVAGYAGSLAERPSRRDLLIIGGAFMLGTVVALGALGAVASFAGQAASQTLGRAWHFAAGLILVLFGLAALRLLPFALPSIDARAWSPRRGAAGAALYGLAVGGATTTCSLSCNPLLPAAVAAAAGQGSALLGASLLAVFALGYSLPLALALVGLGFGLGRLGNKVKRALPTLRVLVGVALIGLGFYLLATT